MAKKNTNIDKLTAEESRNVIGGQLSFAAAEAYKLLRANLDFSLPDAEGCKIIGVTSALRGEGKSTTSINIAYTEALTGKKVLLLEADLRLPTIAKRLNLRGKPGISNLLAGQCKGGDILQPSGLVKNLWVVTAGDMPPNPSELLDSRQMCEVIKAMSDSFDVIFVDLPPITAVSDALVISKLVSGMILVVRQDYCDRASLNEVVRQLEFAEAKILGFVMTGSDTLYKGYKNNRRYKRYRKYSGARYSYKRYGNRKDVQRYGYSQDVQKVPFEDFQPK